MCKCLCGLQQGRGPLQRHARHAPTLHTDFTYIISTPRCRTHALHPSLLSAHATSSTDIHHLRSMTHHIRRSGGRATFRKRGEIISIRRVKEVMSGEWGRGEELREDFWSFFFFFLQSHKHRCCGGRNVLVCAESCTRPQPSFFQPIVYVLLSLFFLKIIFYLYFSWKCKACSDTFICEMHGFHVWVYSCCYCIL